MRLSDETTAARAFALALGAVLVAFSALSDGAYQEDSLTHFVIARGAWWHPANWFDAWGRPGATAFYALGAGLGGPVFGWFVARSLSAVAVAAIAFAAYRIAKGLGVPRPMMAALFVAVQPLLFRLGYDTLTEVPCALFLAVAIERLVHGSPRWSAFLLSLCFMTRFETLVFAPVWLWAAWPARRDSAAARTGWARWIFGAALLAWAPAAVTVTAWAAGEKSPWWALQTPAPEGGSYYGSGLVISMLVNWIAAVGPVVALIVPFGVRAMFVRAGGRLLVGCALAYLATHTVCFMFNLFASGGYPRFMVTIAAPSAVLAAAGLAALRTAGLGRAALVLPPMLAGAVIAADLEIGRFVRTWPRASASWEAAQWGLRAIAAIGIAGFVLAALRTRRERLTRETARRIAVGVGVFAILAQAALFAGYVRWGPSRLTPAQARNVAAAHWLAAHHPGAVVFAANDWVGYALDRPRSVGGPYGWERFAAAGPGVFFVCDVHADDWRTGLGALTVAEYEAAAEYETVYTAGHDRSRVAVFRRR